MGKETKISVMEARTALKGKKLCVYSGWCGTHEYFIVTSVRHNKYFKGKYTIVGKTYCYVVTGEQLVELLNNGRHEHRETCDGCTYTVSLTLKAA